MAKVSFTLVRKPTSPKILHKIVRDEVRAELVKVGEAAVKSRDRVVSNWSNKPEFESKVEVGTKRLRVTTVAKKGKKLQSSNATTADLWKWIDKTGTKAHPIPKQPKKMGALRFPWGGPGSYQSKTGANPARFGGPGTVRNPTIRYAKQVQHPGFPPRNFTEAINKDLKKDFDNAVRRGYRRGIAKIK